ncbi:hypothetical protein PQI23_13365 [Leucobacter sp. USCH14]|uniref:hypothetical protein n=1 Tax=Leucobacter sp. USCH14 TaxID=3024838 RepID=UPI0030B7DCFB
MTIKITAPVADFDGKVAGIRFEAGTAEIDPDKHAAALAYFRRQGYGISGSAPEHPEHDQQRAQADAGNFVPDEKLGTLNGEQLKGIAKELGVSTAGSKTAIAERIVEKRAENGKQSIEQHDARDGADRDGDGVEDATTVTTPAGGEQTGEALPVVPPASEVKGASEHDSVREVEGE